MLTNSVKRFKTKNDPQMGANGCAPVPLVREMGSNICVHLWISICGLKFIRPFLFRDFPHPCNVHQDLIQSCRQRTEVIHLVEKKIIQSIRCKRFYAFCHFFSSRQVFLLGVATIGQHTEMDGEVVVEALGFNQDCPVNFV